MAKDARLVSFASFFKSKVKKILNKLIICFDFLENSNIM